MQYKSILIGTLSFIFICALVSAVDQNDLPTWQDKYVNDYGRVLSTQQVTELRSLFIGIDQETTAEVTFISVEECSPYAPGDLATTLFNKWGVGKADKDNGLLILYCSGENKIFAATGYGLEGILPDSKLGRLLDENYVPKRDSGNVSEGIMDFSQAVSQVIIENKEEVLSGNAGAKISYVALFITLGFIVLIIVYFVKLAKTTKKKKKDKFAWVRMFLGIISFLAGSVFMPGVIGWILIILGFILLNVGRGGAYYGGGSSSGFSGGGGGGFGGGSSGGGGAGR
jgi:uncharacterized protein